MEDETKFEAGQVVTYAGRWGVIVEVHETQANGDPWITAAGDQEAAYRIAWFDSVSDPVPASVLTVPHPADQPADSEA